MEGNPIRLSGTSYAVLSLIGFLGEATPYDLKRTMALSIENFWPVPHTTFYAEPARLAAAGYLEERQEQQVRVTGSVDNKPGDVTVNAEAKDPNSASSEPAKIALRLLGSPGNYKVVDVQAAGVWLSIEQRDSFATFLSRNNGDVKALTRHLIGQTAQIRGGKRSAGRQPPSKCPAQNPRCSRR